MHVLKQTYNIYCGKSHLLHVEYEHNLYTRKEKKKINNKKHYQGGAYIPLVESLILDQRMYHYCWPINASKLLLCRPNCPHTNRSFYTDFLNACTLGYK